MSDAPLLRIAQSEPLELGALADLLGAETPHDIRDLLTLCAIAEVEAKLDEPALAEALELALRASAGQLGPLLPYGSLRDLIAQLARRQAHERHKHDLVAAKLEQLDDHDARRALVERYLGLDPAPLYRELLARAWPDLVHEASPASDRWIALAERSRALLEAIAQPEQASLAQIAAWLEPARSLLLHAQIVRQLQGDALLVAALTALASRRDEIASSLLGHVVGPRADEHAARLATIAAILHPDETRQLLALCIVDWSWRNPEEPEAELTEARRRALVAARTLLPMLGSPLEHLAGDELRNLDDLVDLPQEIETLHALLYHLSF